MIIQPASRFPKILRIAGIVFLVVLAIVAVSLVAGKAWIEHRFLRNEIQIGEGTLRIYGGELSWTLRFDCDSAWYHSPSLQARLGKSEARIGLPLTAKVEVDTAYLRLAKTPDTTPFPKSIPFPSFKIPVAAALNVRAFALENDSGLLISAWNISVHNPASDRVEASIGKVTSPSAKKLSVSFFSSLDWSSVDSVDLEANVSQAKDQIHLKTRHSRANLLRGRASMQAEVADSRVYTRALGVADKTLSYAREIHFELQGSSDDSLRAHARLQSEVRGFPDSIPLILGPQNLEVRLDGSNKSGQWTVQTNGKNGEELLLLGKLGWISLPPQDSLAPIWRRFSASAQGFARNFRVRTGTKITRAEIRLNNAQWNGKSAAAQITTGDSSEVQVEAQPSNAGLTGKFSLRVKSHERWVTAFLDTNVSFAALRANGTLQGKTITASLWAQKVFAYGAHVDSLSATNVYDARGYELTSANLYTKTGGDSTGKNAEEDVWSLTGKMGVAKSAPLLDCTLESARRGSLEYILNRDGSMQGIAKHFEIGAVPYDPVQDILVKQSIRKPVVDANFQWNPKRHSGDVVAQIAAEFKNESVAVQTNARWDAQDLDVQNITLTAGGSSLNAQAKLKMHGKQFYEVGKLRLPDYESVGIETGRFDLAHALSLFQPQPFLKSGEMQGEFSYVDAGGFKGSLVFTKVVPTTAIGDVVLKSLRLDGTGDTLTLFANTTSESMPLFKDSLRLAVTHVLESSQQIRFDAVAADSLHLHLEAVSTHLQSLQGRLQVQGSAPLPENSGHLDHLKVDADFNVPFQNTLEKATLTSHVFEGDYSIPPASHQHFSLTPEMRNGIVHVPNLTLKNDSGDALQGDAEYVLKTGAVRAHVGGGDFALQWTDDEKVALKNLRLDFAMDSSGMRVKGGFSEGTVMYVAPPLHAEGDLNSVTFAFSQPSRARIRSGKEYPSLQFYGSLSKSLIRYRIKSISALQSLFQKQGNKKKSGGRVHPMQMDVRLHTRGDSNLVDSDILRMAWVGDVQMNGLYPYSLVQGRINALNGGLGIENQAYDIKQLEIKWLNAPLEEGEMRLEARKTLASRCTNTATMTSTPQDSCTVITRLEGPLGHLQFSYDSDCGGAFGAGASVAAILYSVQRGCYDASFAQGGGGSYGGKALSLVEPTVNKELSSFVGNHSYSWIAATEVSGLSSLTGHDSAGDTLSQAVSLQVTSKEFKHFRLQLRSGYHVESPDLSNPWENMAALEWRPPLQNYVEDPLWKKRLQNHVSLAASVQTLPVQRNVPTTETVQKTVGLNYNFDFWHLWGGQHSKIVPKKDTSKTVEKIP